MSKNITAVELLMTFVLLLLITVIDETDGGKGLKLFAKDQPKIRHMQRKVSVRGKYKYKEEVIKKIEHDHPCKLTQTAVKITFPGMKEEVLVSFLGYKEPNLMPVQRCKGLCSNEALSPVACVPTKLRYKKVKMQIKTQYLGHDAQERFRELVLEEHEECGCRCLNVRPEHCMEPSLFNNETCSCQCDTSLYNRDQIRCETLDDRTWDPVTCTCRRIEEGVLLTGPNQEIDARKAAEVGGADLPPNAGGGHYHGRHHHHKKQLRPGHDIEQAIIVGCVGEDCEECDDPSHFTKPGHVAVMPKSTVSSSNSWTAIGVCTFLVVVFATTTIYYWQKAKKMAKDMFADHKNETDPDDLDVEEKSEAAHEAIEEELLNNAGGVKSPVEFVKKLCDKKSPLPLPPSKVASPTSCTSGLNPEAENEESSEMEVMTSPNPAANGGKNIMELLLAAAAKRDNKPTKEHHHAKEPNGMAKAASMSELEASQLEAATSGDNQHHHHHHHHHNHRSQHPSSRPSRPSSSRRKDSKEDLEVIEVANDYDCTDCVHSTLLRSHYSRTRSRHRLDNAAPEANGFFHHHPHNMTLDRRRTAQQRNRVQQQYQRPRHYHGSFGHLLDDEDLLQQCLATLMMDAAILRQQQQLQQEQLKLQQEQLAQQQNVIERQAKKAAAEAARTEAAAGTDTQSVIESIAGDAAATTIVTVDHLEVSVEVEDAEHC